MQHADHADCCSHARHCMELCLSALIETVHCAPACAPSAHARALHMAGPQGVAGSKTPPRADDLLRSTRHPQNDKGFDVCHDARSLARIGDPSAKSNSMSWKAICRIGLIGVPARSLPGRRGSSPPTSRRPRGGGDPCGTLARGPSDHPAAASNPAKK